MSYNPIARPALSTPFVFGRRPSGQGVVDERPGGRTARESDQMPIIVRTQAVRNMTQLASHYPQQERRYPGTGANDHSVNHQQLMMTVTNGRPSADLSTSRSYYGAHTTAVRGLQTFGVVNGLPMSAVPDVAFVGVAKGTVDAGDTVTSTNVQLGVQVDGLTTVVNNGPEPIQAFEEVAVEMPSSTLQGTDYSSSAGGPMGGSTRLKPITVPLRLVIDEFGRPLEDAHRATLRFFQEATKPAAPAPGDGKDPAAGGDAGDAKRAVPVLPDDDEVARRVKESIRNPYRGVIETLDGVQSIEAAADGAISPGDYLAHLMRDVQTICDAATVRALIPRELPESQSIPRERQCYEMLQHYFTHLRLTNATGKASSAAAAILAEQAALARGLQMANLLVINRKRRVHAGKSMNLAPPHGGDLTLLLRSRTF